MAKLLNVHITLYKSHRRSYMELYEHFIICGLDSICGARDHMFDTHYI